MRRMVTCEKRPRKPSTTQSYLAVTSAGSPRSLRCQKFCTNTKAGRQGMDSAASWACCAKRRTRSCRSVRRGSTESMKSTTSLTKYATGGNTSLTTRCRCWIVASSCFCRASSVRPMPRKPARRRRPSSCRFVGSRPSSPSKSMQRIGSRAPVPGCKNPRCTHTWADVGTGWFALATTGHWPREELRSRKVLARKLLPAPVGPNTHTTGTGPRLAACTCASMAPAGIRRQLAPAPPSLNGSMSTRKTVVASTPETSLSLRHSRSP
mmetsp:Transcript_38710/g.123055  ORF Transcript_38710/g.123055 Transcript_38710/m.123055 type:complete len:265 (+) Transcript_38710:1354-2148(+)